MGLTRLDLIHRGELEEDEEDDDEEEEEVKKEVKKVKRYKIGLRGEMKMGDMIEECMRDCIHDG